MGAEGVVSHNHTVAQYLFEAGTSLIELETVTPPPEYESTSLSHGSGPVVSRLSLSRLPLSPLSLASLSRLSLSPPSLASLSRLSRNPVEGLITCCLS